MFVVRLLLYQLLTLAFLCFSEYTKAGDHDSILGSFDTRKTLTAHKQTTEVIIEAFFSGDNGEIDTVQISFGFPFRRDMVLTNSHSVLKASSMDRAKFVKITYLDESREERVVETTKIQENPAYVFCKRKKESDCHKYDFSVLRTDPVFKKWFNLRETNEPASGEASIRGFTQCYGAALDENNNCDFAKAEKNPILFMEGKGEFRSGDGEIVHRVDTTNGQSGSCIKLLDDDSSCIGIHSTGGKPYYNFNFGAVFNKANIDTIMQMCNWLQGDKR